MRSFATAVAGLSFSVAALAIPAPAPATSPAPTEAPQLEGRDLSGLLGSVVGEITSAIAANDASSVLSALKSQTATTTVTAPSQAQSALSSIWATASPSNIIEYNALLVANGLTASSVADGIEAFSAEFSAEGSSSNSNPDPPTAVYPKKGACDAPYSISESTLRSAIYIPSTFTYGQKPPVVLFPGTGATGYVTFDGNFIPLLTGVEYADPVWVNVPGFLLDDAQHNAEFAAYALNYIASLTNRNVSIIAWSQGNIDAQWAFKYWPSTRNVTSDHIAISPDYHGTINANFIDIVGIADAPSVLQQQYVGTSTFIDTLLADNGDSGYVPTTVLYSGLFDEIVEPQQGTGASAFLNDHRGVGVTNNEVQLVCPGQPAGSFYTHESMLINPISFALSVDALTHDGPGETSRAVNSSVCDMFIAPGLTIEDFLLTENAILFAGIAILAYEPKVTAMPAISAYATASTTCSSTATASS